MPAILCLIQELWSWRATDPDIIMLWTMSVFWFSIFFLAWELTIPSQTISVWQSVWGDMAVNSTQPPILLRSRLKYAKTNQLWWDMDVFVRKTGCSLCPVSGVLAYMAVRKDQVSLFFKFKGNKPLQKPALPVRWGRHCNLSASH